MHRYFYRFIGKSDNRTLEQVLFLRIAFWAFFGCLALTILNLANKLYFQVIITSSVMTLCGIVFYYAFFKMRYFFVASFIATTIILCAAYFDIKGINGPVPYYFLVVLVFVLVYNPLKWHYKIFILHGSALCILFIIEILFPQSIKDSFASPQVLHIYLFSRDNV